MMLQSEQEWRRSVDDKLDTQTTLIRALTSEMIALRDAHIPGVNEGLDLWQSVRVSVVCSCLIVAVAFWGCR